jgi:hypothetical protein
MINILHSYVKLPEGISAPLQPPYLMGSKDFCGTATFNRQASPTGQKRLRLMWAVYNNNNNM